MKNIAKCDIVVSRQFLSKIENAKVQLSFGIDNLGYMIEAIEDSLLDMKQKESFLGAMFCAYNQIQLSYCEMEKLVEAEYARLRGEACE